MLLSRGLVLCDVVISVCEEPFAVLSLLDFSSGPFLQLCSSWLQQEHP